MACVCSSTANSTCYETIVVVMTCPEEGDNSRPNDRKLVVMYVFAVFLILGMIRHAWTERRIIWSTDLLLTAFRYVSFHMFHMDGCVKRCLRSTVNHTTEDEETPKMAEWIEQLGNDVDKLESLTDSSRAHSEVLKKWTLELTRKVVANHANQFSEEDV